ncbi:MAG: hypothetical protein WB710_12615, partial [Stellaceae bacterium]
VNVWPFAAVKAPAGTNWAAVIVVSGSARLAKLPQVAAHPWLEAIARAASDIIASARFVLRFLMAFPPII